MRLFALAFALLLTGLLATPASAKSFRSPQALLSALYAYDTANTDPDAPSLYSPFFTDALNALFQADADKTEPGDAGTIDFDPVIAGQDGAPTDLEIGEPVLLDDTAEVEVTFRNGEPVTLFYSLVREHGGWKVDDIANQQGEYPWSVRALLEGAGR